MQAEDKLRKHQLKETIVESRGKVPVIQKEIRYCSGFLANILELKRKKLLSSRRKS